MLLSLILLCVSSCVHQVASQKIGRCEGAQGEFEMLATSYDNIVDNYRQYPVFTDEARLLDIPFPINVTLFNLQDKEEDKRKVALIYCSDQSVSNIIAFYRSEMECLGWYEKAIVKSKCAGLVFEKPSKVCLITVQLVNNKFTEVVLFVAPNKYIA